MRLGTLGGGVGEVLNLATNDAMRVYMAVRFCNFSWVGIVFLAGTEFPPISTCF